MLLSRTLLSVLAALGVTASAALAQTMESTPAPRPAKPNFAPFSFMVGTWSCSTKSARRPAAYHTTETWSMDPTGYWLVGKQKTDPMSWFPYASTGEDRITYDPDTGRWVDVYQGDFGGYDLTSSKGWNGSSIVWHDLSFAGGKDVATQSDVTVTKVSPAKMTSTSTFTTAKGRSVGVTSTCTKQH